MAKILIVDDDSNLLRSLSEYLVSENYTVEVAACGLDGLQLLDSYQFDVVLLDWSMPDLSGVELLKKFRKAGGATPIIFLTGRGDVEARMEGLDSGADDYITKPFHLRELSARVRAVLRRPVGLLSTKNVYGNLTFCEGRREVLIDGRTVNLGRREFALLEFLLRNPNRAFSTGELLKAVWPSDTDVSDNAVRVCLGALRKKITGSDGNCIVKTRLGSGYIVETDDSR